ncbi:MAG: hypothetical protein SFU98_11890 [Leptospiraceae bacterium]|nr:hypothetical protein [Leptospiraceae bacterium]
MSLIRKAIDLIQKFSGQIEKPSKKQESDSPKRVSLLDKATTHRIQALPIEELEDETLEDRIISEEKEPHRDTFFSKRKLDSENFLSTQANIESIIEDVIDLDNTDNQFLSYEVPVEKNFAENDFLGNFEQIEFNENSSSEDEVSLVESISPNDTYVSSEENNATPKDSLEDWEKSIQSESKTDPFLSVEESILKEISSDDDSLILNPNKSSGTQLTSSEEAVSSSRLENYLVIMEITKDLVRTNTLSEFFETLVYSIEGQIGAESIFIFSSLNGNFEEIEMVAHDSQESIEEAGTILSLDDSIYQTFSEVKESILSTEVPKENFSEEEVELLEPPIEIVTPLHSEFEFVGFILIGKNLYGQQYSKTDFEFLNLLSEVAGNMIHKFAEMQKIDQELKDLNVTVKLKNSVNLLTDRIYSCRDFNSLYKSLTEILLTEFNISKFSIFLHMEEEKVYYIGHSTYLQEPAKSNFRISDSARLVNLISQVAGFYKIENSDSYPELEQLLSLSDSSLILFPLIHLGKMNGILFIHEADSIQWSTGLKQALTTVSNLLAPMISNIILQTEREFLFKHPFSPVDESISKEIQFALDNHTKFTLIILKIQNVTRILNLLGYEFFTEYTEFITSKLLDSLKAEDSLSRVGQGKYAVFLRQKDKTQAESFFTWIKSEFGKFPYPPKDFKLSIQLYSLTYPDQSNDKRKFIELIEDT